MKLNIMAEALKASDNEFVQKRVKKIERKVYYAERSKKHNRVRQGKPVSDS